MPHNQKVEWVVVLERLEGEEMEVEAGDRLLLATQFQIQILFLQKIVH